MMTYLLAFTSAVLIGVAKSGLKGLGLVIVTFMALAYGSKASTGIVLPLLLLGDIMAVLYYNRHAQWNLLKSLIPGMIIGVLIGVWVGKDIPEDIFKKMMSMIILISLSIMIWTERKKQIQILNADNYWSRFFAPFTGLIAGFATMIGNLAGPFVNIYFLITRIPKNQFIGTAAWLYLIVNFIKMPFHVFSWGTINANSLLIDLYMTPMIFLGFYIGVKIVKVINENFFRKLVLLATGIGAILIFFK